MKRLQRLIHSFELHSSGKWFVLSALVGSVAGGGAIGFQFLGQVIQHFMLEGLAGFHPAEASGEHVFLERNVEATTTAFSAIWIVGVLVLGGLVSGFLVYTFAPEAEGHGTDAAIDAFHNKRGFIRGRIPLIKTLASAVTLGTGGSAGREGPIAQIGAGFGSFLATRLKLSARDRRILLAAGMGAGVGAIFRAPMAGAIFSGEIMYRDADLDADVIVPSAVSSTVAYCVYSLAMPTEQRFTPLFGEHLHVALQSPLELVPYTLLAVLLSVAGMLYIKTFYGMRDLFKRLPFHARWRPAVGAGLAGLVGLGLYQAFGCDPMALSVLATGYGAVQQALDGPQEMGIALLLAIAVVKVLTTSLTISSGGSGGVFGPSMVIGGCLGAAVGLAFAQWWPSLASRPQSFVVVGMAGFFAGSARAPLSTILMVTEMTGDYQLLLPTMWVSTLCFLLGHRFTLYEKQVRSRIDSPAHRGEFIIDVLEEIKVADVYRERSSVVTVSQGSSLDDIVHLLAKTSQRYFPVVDDEGRLVGAFAADDVRAYLYDDVLWQIANAEDVMQVHPPTVTPEDDLNLAVRRFTALNMDDLIVVDPDDPAKIVGMLRRRDTIAAYHQNVMRMKQAD